MPDVSRVVAVVCAALLSAVLGLSPAVALTAPTAPTARTAPTATAAPNGDAAPDGPAQRDAGRVAAAERALAVVAAALRPASPVWSRGSGEPHGPTGDLTMALLDLRRRAADLAPADQRVAARYLARPVDGAADPEGFGYAARADVTHDCRPATATAGSRVCVHWARRTVDAPRLDDRDADGVPNQVERARDVLNDVWRAVVVRGGYLAPAADRVDPPRSPDARLDVYLMDLGPYGFYGYCAAEGRAVRGAAPAYCVLDEDFSRDDFPRHSPLENLQVSAAHELFHAVQFAYDVGEDLWFMEGTAAWVEDELYDDVDDNLQYLRSSPLTNPNRGLDSPARNIYSSWIFWRFLTERFPRPRVAGSPLPDLVRRLWVHARATPTAPGTWSVKAARRALRAVGSDLPVQLSAFAEAARHPARHGHYEEGAAYPVAPIARTVSLSRAQRASGWLTQQVRQLGSATVAFRPGPGLGNDQWRLRVEVDAPPTSHGPFARLTLHRRDGGVASRVVRLDRTGAGRRGLAFSTPEVRRVELTLSNGSARYRCGLGTSRACEGRPLHDGDVTRFRATLVRSPGS